MFKVDFVQMKSILATLVKPVSDQAAVFDALNYNPYDDVEKIAPAINVFLDSKMPSSPMNEDLTSWPRMPQPAPSKD